MSDVLFDRLVESIGQSLPENDDEIAEYVEIISLLFDGIHPRAELEARGFVMKCEKDANKWSKEQNHGHHDCPWIHEDASDVVHIEILRDSVTCYPIGGIAVFNGIQEPPCLG